MRRFIEWSGFLYVTFALLIAYQSLAPTEAPTERSVSNETYVAAPSQTLYNTERLYNDNKKAHYVIEVWAASWCGPCRRYKSVEVPKLKEMGFTVLIKGVDEERAPKDVKFVPTIRLFHKDDFIMSKTYWKAEDINEYVENRMALKK
jgi:thiol-disulfide isomerase/thioredoxin